MISKVASEVISSTLPTSHSPLPTLLCLAAPLSILATAYAWLAVNHGAPWLWDVTVHESGRYTLWETVFYFRHFLREIPVDLSMALFLIAGFMNSHEANKSLPNGKVTRWAWLLLAAAAGLMAAAFVVAASQHSEQGQLGRQGWTSAALDLLQFRTRDDLVEFGSHWRFHWLSTLWFGVAAMLGASLGARLCGQSRILDLRFWLAPWAYFAALTIVFWFSDKIFTDVRYTGHQAREIITHGPVTYLLGFGVLRLLASRMSASQSVVGSADCGLRIADCGLQKKTSFRNPQSAIRNPHFLLLAPFLLIPSYLAAITLSGNLMDAGQSERGLAAMVGAHFFEHVLDYLFVILLATGGYAWLTARRLERQVSK